MCRRNSFTSTRTSLVLFGKTKYNFLCMCVVETKFYNFFSGLPNKTGPLNDTGANCFSTYLAYYRHSSSKIFDSFLRSIKSESISSHIDYSDCEKGWEPRREKCGQIRSRIRHYEMFLSINHFGKKSSMRCTRVQQNTSWKGKADKIYGICDKYCIGEKYEILRRR